MSNIYFRNKRNGNLTIHTTNTLCLEYIHQKKVIDRLSRKIQKRNKEYKKLVTYYGVECSKVRWCEDSINNLLRENERLKEELRIIKEHPIISKFYKGDPHV